MKKYENLEVTIQVNGDFKVLAFVSGNSKAEIIREVKSNINIRNNGVVSIDHEDFTKRINSNK